MTTAPDTDDRLTMAESKPRVADLIADFQGCQPVSNGWHILRNNENVRFCRWENQSADGKKHGTSDKPAFPWENASDVRVPLVDAAINEDVAILVVSFWRALASVGARGTEANDAELAGHVTSLLNWVTRGPQRAELIAEVELSAQYLLTYGLAILHPHWNREIQLMHQRMTLEQLQEVAQGNETLAQLAAIVLDPAQEDNATVLVQSLAQELIAASFLRDLGDDARELLDNYQVKATRARAFVRGLREEGVGVIPVPYVCKNQPSIAALKPFTEVFFNPALTSLNRGRVYRLEWLTETELRAKAAVEGWNADWVDRALTHKGTFSNWEPENENADVARLNSDWEFSPTQNKAAELIEVIHGFYWQVDDDGVLQMTHTVFHASISGDDPDTAKSEDYGLHETMDLAHRELPFVAGVLERWSRRIVDSRGYPERLSTRQSELKVQRDGLIDWTSLAVCPPVNLYDTGMGTGYVFGPDARNTVTPGREPQMMDIKGPGVPAVFQLNEMVRKEVDNELGSLSELVPAPRSQAKKQMLINTFLLMWSKAFTQEFALMAQFMPDEEWQRITGSAKPKPGGVAITRQYDVSLSFDARDLDIANLREQWAAIKEMFSVDRNGYMQTDPLIQFGLRIINPTLADMVLPKDNRNATQRIMEEEIQNLMRMSDGNPPKMLIDADPTAQMRLQAVQEIVAQNPKYQQALQGGADPIFAAQMETYLKNLQFAAEQTANIQRGRTGV